MRRDLSSWLGTLGTTGRKATYRRSRTLKSRGASHSVSLAGGEPLDSKKMLAVSANLVGTGLTIALSADNDIAGLVLNTGTNKYEVYDNVGLVNSFLSSSVATIEVIDSKGGGTGTGQVFEVRDGGAIAASLGVSAQIETTKIFDDIDVTSATTIAGGFGVVVSSPTITIDDASPANPLLVNTSKTDIEFGGVVTVLDATDLRISTGAGAGDIDFLDDVIGGEDGG
ncbi:MAG: hypothetical protein EBZ74_11235, partial [Planctomycetia bacterium]|nr:hypothetical protein [Planctomycetia bacterium]